MQLTITHPFAAAAGDDMLLDDGRVAVTGTGFMRTPTQMWLDPARVAAVVDALQTLEIVGHSDPHPGEAGRRVEQRRWMHDVSATPIGTCQTDRVLVRFTTGTGCVTRAAWQRVLDAFDAIGTTPTPALVDRRLVPVAPRTLDLGDGTVVDLRTPGDLDPERLEAFVQALATRGELSPALPTGTPRRRLVAQRGADKVTLLVHDRAVVREGESFALVPPPAVMAQLLAPPSALRDPVLWREEVTTLSSLTVDGATYARGAVLGEWTGGGDPALVDALASTLATVRAPAGPPPARVVHTIRVTFTPPAGAPSSHTIELGPPGTSGCPGRVDGAGVVLDLPLCTAGMAVAEHQRE